MLYIVPIYTLLVLRVLWVCSNVIILGAHVWLLLCDPMYTYVEIGYRCFLWIIFVDYYNMFISPILKYIWGQLVLMLNYNIFLNISASCLHMYISEYII